MSDIKIFRLSGESVTELEGRSAEIEKSLQTLIEKNLETFLGVRFLASEYSTGKTHGGRIDTLGIDENGCPVIIEYKRAMNENVINQGLFYLDWLMDHKAEFKLLVLERFDKETADAIEWSSPRLLCIAGDFTKYDSHAVQQMNRNIELIRYQLFGMDLLLFDLVNATTGQVTPNGEDKKAGKGSAKYKTVSEYYEQADTELKDRYESLKAFMLALGDDVQLSPMKNYFAFKRIKNFACVEIHTQTRNLLVFAKVNPDTVDLAKEKGFLRDVRKIGHFGTGDLEITIKSPEDFERAKTYIVKSYEAS
jgi:predicted transport protein